MKVFADGSAGGLTAAMSEPYLVGEPDNHGILLPSRTKEMHQFLAHYHGLGYQLAIHAIGDAAIEQVLSGIEKAPARPPQPITGRRHRIEHCGFLDDGQLARMAKAGIDPVPQPIFMYEFGDLYVRNLGEARARPPPIRCGNGCRPASIRPASSADAPVSTTDPFKNLFTMTTRMSNRHTVSGSPSHWRLSHVGGAAHLHLSAAPTPSSPRTHTGRLVAGQAADIAVLSHDVFTCEPGKLENGVRCDLTVLNGKIVFDRAGELGSVAAE